jgi:hypothetical protein
VELLRLPCILQRVEGRLLQESDPQDSYKEEMLRTIKIPQNLQKLGENLPKPNYQPLRLKSIDKSDFVKILEKKRGQNMYSVSQTNIKKPVLTERDLHQKSIDNLQELGLNEYTKGGERSVKRSDSYTENQVKSEASPERLPKVSLEVAGGRHQAKAAYLGKKNLAEMMYKEGKDANTRFIEYMKIRQCSPQMAGKKDYEAILQNIKG